MKNLVIVESPTKAKTISKFLGKDYKVLSSFGHIRDLPKKELGVEVNKDFAPRYVIPTKSKKIGCGFFPRPTPALSTLNNLCWLRPSQSFYWIRSRKVFLLFVTFLLARCIFIW